MDIEMEVRPADVPSVQHVSQPQPYITHLLDEEQSHAWPAAILELKNNIIGSNHEKEVLVKNGLVQRLLKWLDDQYGGPSFLTEVAVSLGSLAMGSTSTIQFLMEQKAVPIILKSLNNICRQYTEGVTRCLKCIFKYNASQSHYLYEENTFGSTYIPHLLSLLSVSAKCQEYVITVLERACQSRQHQTVFLAAGAVPLLTPLLWGPYDTQMPTLLCFSRMCHRNPRMCAAVMAEHKSKAAFVSLMGRDKPSEMQIEAARVLTYLHRGGAIPAHDPIICRKTLSTLVRMCKRDRPLQQNVNAAETLACLIERDVSLQETAAITDHLITTLANYLQLTHVKQVADNLEVDWGSEMKRAAFLAFASLAANDEDIRERIIQQDCFIDQVQTSLGSENEAEVIATLKCLCSLTRSVQQIRTVLHDSAVWKPIAEVFSSAGVELLEKSESKSTKNRDKVLLAIGCMCNLCLEFSPSREAMRQFNAVEILSELCQSRDDELRFNATWCIMSLAYGASEGLRESLLQCLAPRTLVLRLTDPLCTVREKALGLVRNLITGKHAIDNTVKALGSEVIEAVFSNIRNTSMPPEVIQQALCVVSNMSDGPSCKAHIIGKAEDITAVLHYLNCGSEILQLPAIQFISNLVDNTDDDHGSFPRAGSYQRMLTLKNMGVQQMLESLLGTSTQEVEKRAHQTLKCFA